MLHPNGYTPEVLTVFTNDCPEWLHDISRYLVTLNYRLKVAQSAQEAWKQIHIQNPDVLLAAEHSESLAIFQAVRQELSADTQPLLVLIAERPPRNLDEFGVDIIAPPAPVDFLAYQLRTIIDLRSRNAILAQDNRRLQLDLETEKQSAGGINLLRNAIVRNVAHELRTPLLQVKAAVGLLAEEAGGNNTLIGLAQRATTRLEAGVQNITLLNELINESFENRAFEPVQMKEVIDSAIRNLRRSWEHKDNVGRITVQVPARLPIVWGDKHRLVIAVQLLIDNALKFSEDVVEVSAKKNGKAVDFGVRDYGIGIPEDKIDQIYDWFFQVDNSSTRPYGGMGIGLAIVRFILERHRATIKVETTVGKGSKFSFRLPATNLKTAK